MSQSRIKVALVGAGGWGRQHARIFAERPDVDFCAIAGRTLEKPRRGPHSMGCVPMLILGRCSTKSGPTS